MVLGRHWWPIMPEVVGMQATPCRGMPMIRVLSRVRWMYIKGEWRAGFKDGVHGCGGLMRVENPRYTNPLHDLFFEAARQAGIPENDNFNDWGHSQVIRSSPLGAAAPTHTSVVVYPVPGDPTGTGRPTP